MRLFLITAALAVGTYAFGEAQPRLHPTKHFESFSDISFQNDRRSNAEEIADAPQIKDLAAKNTKAAQVNPKHVTNQEYQLFLDATGRQAPAHWQNGKFPKGQDNKPVVNVSYHDANAYAKWANKRLPTREERIKAANEMTLDMELPLNEWISTMPGTSLNDDQQFILNSNGDSQAIDAIQSDLNTSFRVVAPSALDLSRERSSDEFMTPDGGTLNPDQSIQEPGGNIINPDSNPYNYGE